MCNRDTDQTSGLCGICSMDKKKMTKSKSLSKKVVFPSIQHNIKSLNVLTVKAEDIKVNLKRKKKK